MTALDRAATLIRQSFFDGVISATVGAAIAAAFIGPLAWNELMIVAVVVLLTVWALNKGAS